MKIIVATHNNNKLLEIRELLKNTNLELTNLYELNDLEEIIEDGSTYLENALIKSKFISNKYNSIALADDSGLEVEFINNEPGIYSARYSGISDSENRKLILSKLANISNRNARFRCIISISYPNGLNESFEGILEGTIAYEELGTNGFGYDSIFIPKGYNKTLAQLDTNIKLDISHRSNALKKLIEYLKNRN